MAVLQLIHDMLWDNILIFLLIGTGLYFTIKFKFVQLRYFLKGFKILLNNGNDVTDGSVSSWQSFWIASAARIGTGNIVGVAMAIMLGGPGAVFWMWLLAALNMPIALVESTLAQIYQRKVDGQLKGGPAFYIQHGLGKKWLGQLFSIMLILSFGLTFISVQANAISTALQTQFALNASNIALGLAVLVCVVLCTNLHGMARITSMITPVMASLYLGVAIFIMLSHPAAMLNVIQQIFETAFHFEQAVAGGVAYGVTQAMMQGAQKGLFSNEAGMGSAANIAGSVDMRGRNPIEQGFIQMSGVVLDTFVICTATAAIVLLGYDFSQPMDLTGIEIMQLTMHQHFGDIGHLMMTFAVCFFGFSTILGNYIYAENNLTFLSTQKKYLLALKAAILVMTCAGAVLELKTVWMFAFITLGVMTFINLVAILRLSPKVVKYLKQYEQSDTKQPIPVSEAADATETMPQAVKTCS
jgi:alanine or glycine:cation symporter, AGCS family